MTDEPRIAIPKRRVVLCKRCRRDVQMKQEHARVNGVIRFVWDCPKCGSLMKGEFEHGWIYGYETQEGGSE